MSDRLTDTHLDWAAQFCCVPADKLKAGPADASPIVPQLAIDPLDASIAPGGTLQFGATIEEDGTTRIVTADATWTSSDAAVTIDAKGLATAAPGSPTAATRVTIAATLSGTSASTGLTVLPTQPPAPPPLQSIVLVPAKATLLGPGIGGGARQGGGGGQTPAPLQLVAYGTRADGSTVVLTTGLEWTSSAPDLVAVDRNGVVTTAGGLPGTATIAATDTESGALGAAIGGSATIVVEVPIVVAIEIDPAKTDIDLGEERQFGIVRRFSDDSLESIGGGDGSIDWSSDSDALSIGADGSARAVRIGKATLKAVDATSGKTATLALAVDGEIAVDTFAGTFTYAASRQGKVAPLLKAANASFDAAEAAANALSKQYDALTDDEKQIGSLDEITKQIDTYTSPQINRESWIPHNLGTFVTAVQNSLDVLKKNLEAAARNFALAETDLKGATDAVRAEELMRQANLHADQFHIEIKILQDVAIAIATENPSALFDSATNIAEQVVKDNDSDRKQAEKLRDEANQLGLGGAEMKLNMAIDSLIQLPQSKAAVEQNIQKAHDDYEFEWHRVEQDYDTAAGKDNFQFSKLKDATTLAGACIALGTAAEAAANAANVAAAALSRPGEAPEVWMADIQEDERIINAFLHTSAQMAALAKTKAQHAQDLQAQWLKLQDDAQTAIFKAPAAAQPKAPDRR